ncbi:MAG TPA: YncE family protein, partial [Longimicrobiales bacterium]|nr:YncE family protein [Longimicrobiales bacterium]
RRAVATMEMSDRLALVDVTTRGVLRTYPTGGREGHMVRLSPDGSRAYVTSRGAEGTLSVIFLAEDRGPVVIPTGEGAEGIAVTPDGGEVWVANRDARTISIVDAGSLGVVATLETPPDPRRVEITSTGRALVPNGAGPGAVAVYDVGSRELLENASVGEGRGFGVLAHGSSAFLSDRATGEILIWDPDRPEAVRTLATGHEEPDGMAWSPRRVAPFD